MESLYLYNRIAKYKKKKCQNEEDDYSFLSSIITSNLSPHIKLRPYQRQALTNFIVYLENRENFSSNTQDLSKEQIHTLFHMATGSGKTVIMASLILYLYTKGYRSFHFFVNQTNVLEKTIDNFTNPLSIKYLFNKVISYLGNTIKIKRVDNFSSHSSYNYYNAHKLDYSDNSISFHKYHNYDSFNNFNNFSNSSNTDDIEIIFTTTQKLHMDLSQAKENGLTYDDFENNKIVFISDESHHINSLTKKPTKDEDEAAASWEYSITNAFKRNSQNILLEFTATCDLKDKNVLAKYQDKIVFNYPLISFRESGYTKDFQNFATDTDLWTRTLIALVMSEYRRFLFADLKLNIKPVIMLKSQKISESVSFYNKFFEQVKALTTSELDNLASIKISELSKALNYFKDKDPSLEILEHAIKQSFTIDTAIIMNGSSDNNKENQLLVNSLEDENNPIRLIFTVDMLNEGWDVLNLFDIVRLYDTKTASVKLSNLNSVKSSNANSVNSANSDSIKLLNAELTNPKLSNLQLSKAQSTKSTQLTKASQIIKVGSYTIKEAQLIGRGARYCPFVVDDNLDFKFKRKYDNDITNPYRVLETMYFHSKNDSSYIAELKQALIDSGLQALDFYNSEINSKQYTVYKTDQDNSKESELFDLSEIALSNSVDKTESNSRNKTKPNSLNKTKLSLMAKTKSNLLAKTYCYSVFSEQGNLIDLISGNSNKSVKTLSQTHTKNFKFKDLELNILLGAIDSFNELKFSELQKYFPKLTSTKEFLTADEFLGNSNLEITYTKDELSARDKFNAVKHAFAELASQLSYLD